TFRQRTRVNGLRKRLVMSRRDLWVAVVTEHAIVTDGAAEAVVIGTVIARVHRPVAPFFGIPAKRHFDERAAPGPMQVRSRMVTGSHDVVDLLLHQVDLFAGEVDLITALIEFAVPPEHGEGAVRSLMVKGVFAGVVFYRV